MKSSATLELEHHHYDFQSMRISTSSTYMPRDGGPAKRDHQQVFPQSGDLCLPSMPDPVRPRRRQPSIVLNGASIAVAVVHQIRRIGEDEIDAIRRHLAHHFDAVAVKDLVGEAALLCDCY